MLYTFIYAFELAYAGCEEGICDIRIKNKFLSSLLCKFHVLMFRKAVFLCYANNFFSGNFVWWCFFLTPQLCWKLLMDKKIYNSDYCFKHLSRSLFMNVLKNHRGLYESITAWRKYRQKNQLISNRKQTQMKIFRSRTLFKSDRVIFFKYGCQVYASISQF